MLAVVTRARSLLEIVGNRVDPRTTAIHGVIKHQTYVCNLRYGDNENSSNAAWKVFGQLQVLTRAYLLTWFLVLKDCRIGRA